MKKKLLYRASVIGTENNPSPPAWIQLLREVRRLGIRKSDIAYSDHIHCGNCYFQDPIYHDFVLTIKNESH